MLRWLTAGESHGPALVATVDGLPAGVEVTTDDLAAALGVEERAPPARGHDHVVLDDGDRLSPGGGERHRAQVGNGRSGRRLQNPDPRMAASHVGAQRLAEPIGDEHFEVDVVNHSRRCFAS